MSAIDKTEMGEWLCAYLDGALSGEERALVEQLLNENTDAQALLDVLRDTSQAVRELPRHSAPDTILEDIRNQLERSELIGDEPEALPRSTRGSSAFSRWAIAAMLGFAAVGGIWAMVDRFGPDRPTHLASAPAALDKTAIPLNESAKRSAAKDTEPKHLANRAESRRQDRSAKPRSRASARRRTHGPSSIKDQPTIADSTKPAATAKLRPSPSLRSSVASVTPLQPIDTPMLERMILKDRKLGQAWPASAIRRHRFENEPVRLTFDSPDEFARNILARSLIRHLRAGSAVDLKERRPSGAASPFYLEGIAGVNFDSKKARQILLRLPKSRVSHVLGGLLSDTSKPYTQVKLKVDSFSVDGRESVVSLLDSLAPKQVAAEAAPTAATATTQPATLKRHAGNGPKAPVGGMFAGLLRVIGIDPSLLTPPTTPREEHKEPGPASTLARADASPAHDLVRDDAKRSPDNGKGHAEGSDQGVAAEAVGKQTSANKDEGTRKSLVEKRLEALRRPSPPVDADQVTDMATESTLALKKERAKREPPPVVAPREWITIIVELNVPEPPPPKPAPPAKAPVATPDAPKPGAHDKPSHATKPKK